MLVSPAQLVLPPYTVSSTNPLPAGVSAKQVVQDVVIDNLIENAAIVKSRPALLSNADVGDLLASEQGEITTDRTDSLTILDIDDDIQSIQVGTKPDPNFASSDVAALVTGTETVTQRKLAGHVVHHVTRFDVLLWAVWDKSLSRYLLCDIAES